MRPLCDMEETVEMCFTLGVSNILWSLFDDSLRQVICRTNFIKQLNEQRMLSKVQECHSLLNFLGIYGPGRDPLSSAPRLTYMSINLYNLPGNSVAFTSIPTYQPASAECDVIHHSATLRL